MKPLTPGEQKLLQLYRRLLGECEENMDIAQAVLRLSDGKTLTLTICAAAHVVRSEDWDGDDDDLRRRLAEEA